MISQELFSIRVETNLQTMEMTSWWRNLFLSFSHSRFSEKRWMMEMDVNENFQCHFEKKKANKQTSQLQFSMVCTLIDHRNDVKMFKTLRWNH